MSSTPSSLVWFSGEAGLVADNTTMRLVVLGYMVPVARTLVGDIYVLHLQYLMLCLYISHSLIFNNTFLICLHSHLQKSHLTNVHITTFFLT